MQITFSPQRCDTMLSLARMGDVLVVNGEAFDFSVVPEGGILPRGAIASPWFAGDVCREDGVLLVPMILPHGAAAPEETRFPVPLTVEVDGPVVLPPHSLPEEQEV